MSQNLRVATWVPVVDPDAIGNAIHTSAMPTANKRIPSEFAIISGGGGSGGVSFASSAEVIAGVVGDEAISPSTLRNEMMREFAIPAATFTAGAIAVNVSVGGGSGNKLIKTDFNGVIDHSLLLLDGGTF